MFCHHSLHSLILLGAGLVLASPEAPRAEAGLEDAALVLSVSGLVGGGAPLLILDGATPYGNVAFAYSLTGPGPTAVGVNGCGTIDLELDAPLLIGIAPADGAGIAALMVGPIPPGASGMAVWLDAIDLSSCGSPPGLAEVIG